MEVSVGCCCITVSKSAIMEFICSSRISHVQMPKIIMEISLKINHVILKQAKLYIMYYKMVT